MLEEHLSYAQQRCKEVLEKAQDIKIQAVLALCEMGSKMPESEVDKVSSDTFYKLQAEKKLGGIIELDISEIINGLGGDKKGQKFVTNVLDKVKKMVDAEQKKGNLINSTILYSWDCLTALWQTMRERLCMTRNTKQILGKFTSALVSVMEEQTNLHPLYNINSIQA